MPRSSTFTTYINAKDDPSVNSAFDRLTNKAVSSYQKIASAAQVASKAQLGLIGGGGSAGGSSATAALTRSLDGQARSVNDVAKAYRSASPAVTGMIQPTRAQGAAAELAAKNNRDLAQSLRTTASALAVAQGPMGPIAGRVLALANAAERLTGFRLGLVGVGAALFSVGRMGNNYALLTSQLNGAFLSQTRSNQAMEDIIGIADRAKVSLESVTGLYIRLSQASQAAGIDARTAARVTEVAAKSARLSGGSSQTQNAALTQFTQAFGANFKGGGQELQSILEGANQLAQTIADGLGVPITALKKMGEQGELSTTKVANALLKMEAQVDQRSKAIGGTLGASLTQLSNNATVMVGKFDQAIGFTSTLSQSISVVADNLRAITGLIIGVGVAVAASRFGPMIAEGIVALNASMVAIKMEQELKRGNALQDRYYAQEAVADSAREVAATEANVRALVQEKIAIEAKIAALREERIAAAAVVQRARANPTGITGYSRGVAGTTIGDAEDRAQKATRELSNQQEKLRTTTNALGTEMQVLGAAQQRNALATQNAGETMARAVPKVGLLAGGLSKLRAGAGLVASFFGGPLGIAIGVATTAMFLYSTAQSEAERATKNNEDAQRDFELQIDRTTGKVNKAIGALELLAAQQKQTITRTQSVDAFVSTKDTIANRLDAYANPDSFTSINGLGGQSFTSRGKSPAQQQLDALIKQFRAAPGDYARKLQEFVVANQKALPGIQDILPQLGADFGQLRTQAKDVQRSSARTRVITGKGREGDLARALGQAPGAGEGAQPLTAAQRNAAIAGGRNAANAGDADALKRAAGERDKALADLKKQTNLTAEQMAEQSQAIYARYNQEVESIRAARKAASADAVQRRKDARDAIQDAKDAAQAKADTDLTALYKSGLDPNSNAFIEQRNKILKTYDDQVNKLDASAAASHRATSQILADAKKEAEAAKGRGEKRTAILANYDDSPKAIDRARKDLTQLQELVGHVVGEGLYTQAMAEADARRIYEGVQRPLTDVFEKSEEQLAVNRLLLQGRDDEAAALQQALDLQRGGAQIDQSRYEALIKQHGKEQDINDALQSRQRITGQIQALTDTARDSLTGLLTDIQTGQKVKDPQASFINGLFKVTASQLTEKLFAGADKKVRDLIAGRSGVDKAVDSFAETVDNIKLQTDKTVDALSKLEKAFIQSVGGFKATPAEVAAAIPGGVTGPGAGRDLSVPLVSSAATAAVAALAVGGKIPDMTSEAGTSGDILVMGTRLVKTVSTTSEAQARETKRQTDETRKLNNKPLSARDASGAIFANIGSKFDDVVNQLRGKKKDAEGVLRDASGQAVSGTSFFSNIGKQVGQALNDAGNGQFASGIAEAVGIKQSKLGASIGGAIGGAVAGPIGSFVGGFIGGTIGGLFKKTPASSSTVGFDSAGNFGATKTSGTDKDRKAAAGSLASAVGSQIQSVADQLSATINGVGSVSLGTRKDKFVLDTAGQGRTKGSGVIEYDTEEEAVQAAVKTMLERGVIGGISAASSKILASGQDLQRALTKATAIESIPKRLLALTDPVRSAVTDLNSEFAKLISYLNEGGATAQQFADAQKLYELERANAIKSATQQASDAIDTFIKNMVGGSQSPLNKRDTYANASSQLNAFRSDIASGKAVDQDKLLAAANNFQDASRNLYGSSQSFFDDFDALKALLEKARSNNATPTTDPANLPGSPFDFDAGVQAALASIANTGAKATQDQTAVLAAKLDTLTDAVLNTGNGGGAYGERIGSGVSPISLLPSFQPR